MADDETRRRFPPHLRKAQAEIGAWTTETFPEATTQSQLEHLRREVLELIESDQEDAPADCAGEAADCLLLLLGYAHRRGFDLLNAAEIKHHINQGREWGAPDEDGVREHTATPPAPAAPAPKPASD